MGILEKEMETNTLCDSRLGGFSPSIFWELRKCLERGWATDSLAVVTAKHVELKHLSAQ